MILTKNLKIGLRADNPNLLEQKISDSDTNGGAYMNIKTVFLFLALLLSAPACARSLFRTFVTAQAQQTRQLIRKNILPLVAGFGPTAFLAAATAGTTKALDNQEKIALQKKENQRREYAFHLELNRDLAKELEEERILGTKDETYWEAHDSLREQLEDITPSLSYERPSLFDATTRFIQDLETLSDNQARTQRLEVAQTIMAMEEMHAQEVALLEEQRRFSFAHLVEYLGNFVQTTAAHHIREAL